MTIDKIRQTILSEATAEATYIIEGARKRIAATLDAQKVQIEREAERLINIKYQAIKDEYRRKLIQHKSMSGKKILEKRNQLVRSVFETARATILNWPEERYGKLMGRLIEKATGDSGGVLRIHETDRTIFAKLLLDINARRETNAGIILDESHPLKERGGFIFIGMKYEVEQTLETILIGIEQEILPSIAQELFKRQEA